MTASTIYNSYSIALPSVQVAGTYGQGLLSRGIEAVARCIARSILQQPVAQPASTAMAPAHWRTEAVLRQQGMREWLATQQPTQVTASTMRDSAADAARVHKALWLELVG